VNQAATEILGEAATDRMALTIHREGQDPERDTRRGADAEGVRRRTRRRCCRCDRDAGAELQVENDADADSDGRLLGTVTTLEDVTSLQIRTGSRRSYYGGEPENCAIRCCGCAGLYALNQGFAESCSRCR